MLRFLFVVFCLSYLPVSRAQKVILRQSCKTGIYQQGEKIRVTCFLNDKSTDSLSVIVEENFSTKTINQKIKYPGDTLVIFDKSYNIPTSVIFTVKTSTESESIGSVVEAGKFIPGTKRPKDFDKYWRAEKRRLKKLSMIVNSIPVVGIEKGYSCENVEINCNNVKPARGYFAKPESEKEKSLPIVLYVHAAGRITDAWVRSEPENALRFAKMGHGALSFDLNAHGMLNGQPNSYYENLEYGELKNYAQIGLASIEDIYFKGMYLRLIRTLEFLKKQPEWDGKRILVIGESQGGGQALAAAGFDSSVSAVVAIVPAMCDWGGLLVGRKGSWPYPFATAYNQEKMLSVLPYFDVAHILKGSKAKLFIEIGLIDTTCPATALFAAINQAKGEKMVFTVPYRGHHMNQSAYKEIWEKEVSQPRSAFIEDYLK